jgi:hypothetical protein
MKYLIILLFKFHKFTNFDVINDVEATNGNSTRVPIRLVNIKENVIKLTFFNNSCLFFMNTVIRIVFSMNDAINNITQKKLTKYDKF